MPNEDRPLEFLQAIITRMASNSFLVKGWAVTLCSALMALGAREADRSFAFLALYPAMVFWCLDAYYLSLERRYRLKYEDLATALGVPSLRIGTEKPPTFMSALFSPAVWPLYLSLVVLVALVGARCVHLRC